MASFDAVAAFYSLTHLPPGDLPPLLCAISGWLRPEGLLVASMGDRFDSGSVEQDWLGVPMYFAVLQGTAAPSLLPARQRG